MAVTRLVIYSKDVQRITGKSERSARDLMLRIRLACNKARHQPVSVTEFCHYTGLKKEEVELFL